MTYNDFWGAINGAIVMAILGSLGTPFVYYLKYKDPRTGISTGAMIGGLLGALFGSLWNSALAGPWKTPFGDWWAVPVGILPGLVVLAAWWLYVPNLGVKCPNCGKTIRVDARECRHCSHLLSAAGKGLPAVKSPKPKISLGSRILHSQQAGEFLRIFQDPVLFISLILIIIFVGTAIVGPIYMMVKESRTEDGQKLFERYLDSPVYQEIIANTIYMGLIVGGLGTTVGMLMAFVQVKVDVPFKRYMHWMSLVPVVSPPFALASSVLLLFGRNGMITKKMFGYRYDIYGLDGLSLVLTLSLFTVAYLNLKGMMQALDPALDEASTNLGASKFRIFFTVTLPMLLPGIAGSFLLIFVEALADLGNPLVLGGNYNVLAARVYTAMTGEFSTLKAAVLSVILLVPSLVVFVVQRYWVNRLSVISVTGKPSGRPQKYNHPLVRWPLWFLAMTISLLITLIYAVIFVGAFVRVPNVNWAFTLDHFDFVINGYGSEAMKDTTQLAAAATPIAGLLGILIAFIVVRKKFFGRGLLDFASMLGIAVPGTILGIGYLLMFNTPNTVDLPLVGTVTLTPKLIGGRAVGGGAIAIVMVYIVRSVPAALRAGISALSQIDPVIEEASISLGANNFGTFRRITLPLIRPAFFSGLVFAFARSMTTISAIVFLTTPKTKIMTAQILNEVENGRYGNAFAYCVILIGIVMSAIVIMQIAVGTRSGAERSLEGGG